MSKVKLDLRSKDPASLAAFATKHRNAIAGNPVFLTPVPTTASFNATLLTYQGKIDAITVAEVQLATLREERDALRVPLEANLNARAVYVETQSGGDTAKIVSVAFAEGEIDVSCHAVQKAGGYVSQRRDHSDVTAPGPWGNDKFSTRSSVSHEGLVAGHKYAFRTKAMGPNDLESAWSDEVICMAP